MKTAVRSPISLLLLKILPVVLLLLASHNSWGQYRVSTCDELALRPVDPITGDDLLAIHLDTEKYGDQGCLVHHHPNGKDYVITPTSWGNSPNSARMVLIKAAMEAIADSRKKYANYGDLSEHLYYIFDHLVRKIPAKAFWLVGDGCWMVSGESNIEAESEAFRKQLFAHEIGHCFVMKNVENLNSNYNDLNHWFDESVSEYLSSEVYPETNREHYIGLFKYDTLFRQKYRAYPLWYYYAQENGISSIVPLMNALTELGTSSSRLEYMRDNDLDRLFQHFLFDLSLGLVTDPGGGYIPTNAFTPDTIFRADPMETQLELPPVKHGERESFFITIPQGYDLTISPPKGSDQNYFQSYLVYKGKKIKDWVSPITVSGRCEDTTATAILLSHLNDAAIAGLIVEYELKERTNCCAPGTLVEANPWEDVNGTFYFDHYIESLVTIESPDDYLSMDLNYYVNSKDGSIYFSDENMMNIAAGLSSDEFHGAIWMANGQNVIYGYDQPTASNRALTIATDQTKQDV
ncbi:MAG: hypothetical protein OER04_16170, partial [Cyclobacteriaceae bacterium]|nr:hypothetical protein [Cyclobacteriaceae bacterium]